MKATLLKGQKIIITWRDKTTTEVVVPKLYEDLDPELTDVCFDIVRHEINKRYGTDLQSTLSFGNYLSYWNVVPTGEEQLVADFSVLGDDVRVANTAKGLRVIWTTPGGRKTQFSLLRDMDDDGTLYSIIYAQDQEGIWVAVETLEDIHPQLSNRYGDCL